MWMQTKLVGKTVWILFGIFAITLIPTTFFIIPNEVTDFLFSSDQHSRVNTCAISRSQVQKHLEMFWQEIEIPPGGLTVNHQSKSQIIYAHVFYYDNRTKLQRNNRVLSYISSEQDLEKSDSLWCFMWTYAGWQDIDGNSVYTITQVKANLKRIEVSRWMFRGKRYMPFLVSCNTNQDHQIPQYITLSYRSIFSRSGVKRVNMSSIPVPNLLQVVIPTTPPIAPEVSKDIGMCCHGLHGEITQKDIPYFVQWVETALMFGVNEITLYNVSLQASTGYFSKVVDYFSKTRRVLNFNKFLPLPPCTNLTTNTERRQATESLVRHTSGDCLLRNMHKYYYILYLDTDEIAVPRNFETYQDFLTSYIKKYSNLLSLHSVSVRSAYYYFNIEKFADKNISTDFPILRYNNRTAVEVPQAGYPAYSKSFINPLLCDVLWQHRCLGKNFMYVDEKDILIHHYRKTCPKNNFGTECEKDVPSNIRDPYLVNNYKHEIMNRTLRVLEAIGWNK